MTINQSPPTSKTLLYLELQTSNTWYRSHSNQWDPQQSKILPKIHAPHFYIEKGRDVSLISKDITFDLLR